MTELPENWKEGDTFHASDMNAVDSVVNADTEAISALQAEATGTYHKPAGGIPDADMSPDVERELRGQLDYGFMQSYIGYAPAQTTLGGYQLSNLQAIMQGILDVGGRWLRFNAWWGAFEPTTRNTFDWTGLDLGINTTTSYGIQPLILITSPAPTYSTPSAADFGNACGALAARYGSQGTGQVKYYEIWNEPNQISSAAPFSLGASNYVPVLAAAANAIRAADPQAVIVMSGLMPLATSETNSNQVGSSSFLQGVYDNGGKNFFDIVAYHWYTHQINFGAYEAPSITQIYYEELLNIRTVMTNNNDTAKPVWITEMGIPTLTVTDVNNRTHWLAAQIKMLHDLPWVQKFFIFSYRDLQADQTTSSNTFGAVDWFLTKRQPYWDALRSINQPVKSYFGDNSVTLAKLHSSLSSILVTKTGVPATSSSAGTIGQIAADGTHLYVCVNTNSWVRVTLSTF